VRLANSFANSMLAIAAFSLRPTQGTREFVGLSAAQRPSREGIMKLRVLVTASALVGFFGASTLAARSAARACPPAGGSQEHRVCCAELDRCCAAAGDACCPKSDKQWSIANFAYPVLVGRALVSGTVLIVHDDVKMAQGEPCTTFYRFDPIEGTKEALVSFHCKPRRAERVESTTLTTEPTDFGVKRLVEYQISGDTEAHGIPLR
jgi:hypothetical protein